MIKSLKDARITDGLPRIVAKQDWVIALSGALGLTHQQIMEYADKSQIYTAIDDLDDEKLDILAVQFNSPFYSQDMEINVKREIIKKTLKWYMKAGTPGAVKEMIQTVFGEGDIVEWFNFPEGEQVPGEFEIITNAELTPDVFEQFARIIDKVKNVRSHLRSIQVTRDISQVIQVAAGVHQGVTYNPPITCVQSRGFDISTPHIAATATKQGVTYNSPIYITS